jgi:uncharacterized protein (DUF4415 family)
MKSASSLSAKRPSAKSKSTVKKSVVTRKTRSVKSIATAEHPEADVKHIVRGIVRRGLKPLVPKVPVTLRIDPDVLEWFKHEGEGYQTRMNAVLRAYRDAASA